MKNEIIKQIMEMNNNTIKNYLKQLTNINLPEYRRISILSKIGTLNVENQTLQAYLN